MGLSLLPWIGLGVAGILAMHWGASRVCGLLEGLRLRFGLSAAAGGAFMGIATASPEISVNIASVAFGWPDLGLGAALGSNVPALPLVVLISYLATRSAAPPEAAAPPPPRVQPEAVPVQVVPYLAIVLLLGALTLPPPIAGLQPIDGAILAVAFIAYIVSVLWRAKAEQREPEARCDYARALVGVPVIALGALASVTAARRITDALDISDLVGGLFLIGLLCALPESFAAWTLARKRRSTTAISGAAADGIVSLTLALIPPSLVGAAVGNVRLYAINLAFLVGALVAYMLFNHHGRGQELGLGRVSLYVGAYGVYLATTVFVLNRDGAL
jgi:cation:H+ antiporter